MAEILFKELSYAIVGAAMEVHRLLGPGFLETVYQAALAHELTLRRIPFEQQVKLPVYYKSILIGEYIADFVIDGKIILEIKAVTELHDAHRAQAINYLAATGLELAILLNFGGPSLKQDRLVRFKNSSKIKSPNS
ncbi:MAG: GxxExxY protein [Chloroflexota bacterium]